MDRTERLAGPRNASRLFVGLVICALGMLALLDNLGVIEFGNIWSLWPLVLVALGMARLLRPPGCQGRFGGVILVLIGGWFLLNNLGIARFNPGVFWPLLIVLLGGRLIWGATRRGMIGPIPEGASRMDAFAMLGGTEHKSNSADFRGGAATAILGGCKIDLRLANVKEPPAVLDLFVMWGGVEIFVPREWGVSVQGTPIMGAFEDKTSPPPEGAGPKLIVKGVAIMGGVEIKN
jgi:predicted membrane protein